MKQRFVKQLESGLTEITQFEFVEKRVSQCSVSVRKKRQKRGSGYLSSVKTGRIVAPENLHVSEMTIGKQCSLLAAGI